MAEARAFDFGNWTAIKKGWEEEQEERVEAGKKKNRKPKWLIEEERERAKAIEEVMEARGVDSTTVEEVMDIVSGGEEEGEDFITVADVIPTRLMSEAQGMWGSEDHPLLRHIAYRADCEEDDRFATLTAVIVQGSCLMPHEVVLPNPHWDLEAELRRSGGRLVKQIDRTGGGCQQYQQYGLLVGESGSGKTALMSHVGGLIEGLEKVKPQLLGSGEGLLTHYKRREMKEIMLGGKLTKVLGEYEWKERIGLWVKDEFSGVLTLIGRDGATLGSLFLEMHPGAHVGFRNKGNTGESPELEAHGYRTSILGGIQPGLTGDIFKKKTGGFPQRFIWSLLVSGWGIRDGDGWLWMLGKDGELVKVDLKEGKWDGWRNAREKPLRLAVGGGLDMRLWGDGAGGRIDALIEAGELVGLEGCDELVACMVYEDKVRQELLRLIRLGKVDKRFLKEGELGRHEMDAHRAGILSRIAGQFAAFRGSMKVTWKDWEVAVWYMNECSDKARKAAMLGGERAAFEEAEEAGKKDAIRRRSGRESEKELEVKNERRIRGRIIDKTLEMSLEKQERDGMGEGEIIGGGWVSLSELISVKLAARDRELGKRIVDKLIKAKVMNTMLGEVNRKGVRPELVRLVRGIDVRRK